MPQIRYTPKATYDVPCLPFANAEEAWFWYIRCQRVRWDGARFLNAPGETIRPCDPDDLYRAVSGLARARVIGGEHLRVLGTYGLRECPPDPRCREEQRAARLWDESLDRLTTVLRRKGIVE